MKKLLLSGRGNTMKHIKYCQCVKCGKTYAPAPDITTCECGGILDVIYDYDYIKTKFNKEVLAHRDEPTMWRYRELLPIEEDTVPAGLRVGMSPMYEADNIARDLGIKRLYIKDDGVNPTASLKDRGGLQHHRLLLHRQRRLIACGQRGKGRAQNLHLCTGTRAEGQDRPADDVRRKPDRRGRQL